MKGSYSYWILDESVLDSLLRDYGCCRLGDGGETRRELRREGTFRSSGQTSLTENRWSHNWSHLDQPQLLVVQGGGVDVLEASFLLGLLSAKTAPSPSLLNPIRSTSDWLLKRARQIWRNDINLDIHSTINSTSFITSTYTRNGVPAVSS